MIFTRKYPYIKWFLNRKKIDIDVKTAIKKISKEQSKINKEQSKINEEQIKLLKEIRNECSARKEKEKIKDRQITQLTKNFLDIKRKLINSNIINGRVKNLIVTTYPEHASKNVGDAMITEAYIKLIYKYNNNFKYEKVFREEELENIEMGTIENILLPGFSVVPNTYDENYKLFSDGEKINSYNFQPFGCSYQDIRHDEHAFKGDNYDQKSIQFFKNIAEKNGPIPCRDQLITSMLESVGIPAYYCGDLVLFDPEVINIPFKPNYSIKKVAFTVQHNRKYINQSLDLLEKVHAYFGKDIELTVTFHSNENEVTDTVKKKATELGIPCKLLAGDSINLSFYDEFDFHIGYRLHGHISFLRRRKPSILIMEDTRAFGFGNTKGTDVGCFYGSKDGEPDKSVPQDVINYIEEHNKNGFIVFREVFNWIDTTYIRTVEPYFKALAKRV
ncbi:polysaccharide pyruvyl transferase family protein [Photobacterium profundum]|uniref:Polysaccharide pyruvyl transferase domain-containing protein n=1 Tax=Photobacterium profundum (strain SS9) TaxID=298386 RepID=Q6LNP2_PHOPR|nr:polysaccharide pyruvyl transferase family protein [Photobacterium profundum]CAG21084.1 hypothetical protein PBPRA2706 [Photobacterium profundum SS9]